MKILFVHNYYGSSAPSGENAVVDAEIDLLIRNGHDVQIFSRYSDDIRGLGVTGLIKGAVNFPWSFRSYIDFRNVVRKFEPDIVHVHNVFPLISSSIFHLSGFDFASVLTLHNYRIFCSAAIPMRRNGEICIRCLEKKSILPSLAHGCYRSSRLANFPVAVSVALHRTLRTWERKVDAFIALTDFQRDLMVKGGLPPEKLHVKPNFFPGSPEVVPFSERRYPVVFAGRLSREKGVEALVRAWNSWGAFAPQLVVVGDGPMRQDLIRLARHANVEFVGKVSSSETHQFIANAQLLVVPSEWFECFPMTIREAFAFGTPVLVSSVGPLPSLVTENGRCGEVFEVNSNESLLSSLKSLMSDADRLVRYSAVARKKFELFYRDTIAHEQLMSIYDAAIEARIKSGR